MSYFFVEQTLLAAIAVAQEDKDSEASFEVAIAALRDHGASNEKIAAKGCEAVCEFANMNEANRAKLGKLGACEVVVQTLEASDATRVAAYWACKAMYLLALDNEANTRALVAAGGLTLVTAFVDNQGVLEDVRKEVRKEAFSWLSLPDEMWLVMEIIDKAKQEGGGGGVAGGADGEAACVVKMMKALKTQRGAADNELIAAKACEAIILLTCNDDALSALLGRLGACEVVIDILRLHGASNERIAAKGLEAIDALASKNEANRVLFGRVGACEVLVQVLVAHEAPGKDGCGYDNNVAFWGCSAVFWLSSDNDVNKQALLAVGAAAIVTAISEDQHVSQDTRDGAKVALERLCEQKTCHFLNALYNAFFML